MTADSLEGCVIDGIRRTAGGNSGTGPVPNVTCEHLSALYCPGESFRIDTSPCEGTCTCQNDGAWSCDYEHSKTADCSVTRCVVGDTTWDVGSDGIMDDGCTLCACTRQGYFCDSTACERSAFCMELESEYASALADAKRCDPDTFIPQCTERFSLALGCEGLDVPVNVTDEVARIAAKFRDHGCVATGCPPKPLVRGSVRCNSNSVCTDGP